MENLNTVGKKVFLMMILLCSHLLVDATTTFTSTQNGNWNDANTWGHGGFLGDGKSPAVGDNVVIKHVVTLNRNESCNSLTINDEWCSSWLIVCLGYTNPELKLGTYTLTVAGSFTNNERFTGNSGTLTIAGSLTNNDNFTANTSTVNVTGSFTNNGTFTANTGTFKFTGNGTIGGTNDISFYNLVTNSAGTVTLGKNISITNALTMTSGKINLATYTVDIGIPGVLGLLLPTPGTINYTAGWMYGGKIKRYFGIDILTIGSSSGLFPIGSATDYRPCWIANEGLLTTGGAITLSHTAIANSQAVNFMDNTWSGGSAIRFISGSYWTMQAEGIAIGVSFSIRMKGTGFGPVNSVNDLSIAFSDGVVGSYSASGGTTSNPEINRTGIILSSLGIAAGSQGRGAPINFYMASKSGSSPLPISLLKFEGKLYNKMVDFSWTTASETNNNYFTVEKSADAFTFEKVIDIKGAGNSTTTLKYTATDDNPLTGVSYYRLKQTDFDGKYTYSNLVPIKNVTKINSDFNIYPNPAKTDDILKIEFPEEFYGKDVLVNVYDALGNKVYSNKALASEWEDKMTISYLQNFKTGVYFVILNSDQASYNKRLIIN